MKTKRHKLQDGLLLVLFLGALAALGYGLFHYFGTKTEGAVEAAVPAEAEAVFYVNLQAINQSAFGRAMAEDEARDTLPDEFAALFEALGLAEDDVVEGLIAIRSLSALQQERLSQAGVSGALRLATPITLQRIESALREHLAGNGAEIRQTSLGDRPVLEFPVPDLEVTFQLTVFEREDGGATLYFGDAGALRDTIAKLESRREKALPPGIGEGKNSMMADSHAWLVALLTPQMQTELRETLDAIPFPLGPAGQAAGSLHRTGMSLRANQSLAVQIALSFGSSEDARTVQGFLNENIIPMLGMMAGAQGNDVPDFLGGLRTEASDDTVTLTTSITVDDARRMGETVVAEAAPPQPEPVETPEEPGTVTAWPEAQPSAPTWPELHVQTILLATNEAVINGELLEEGDEYEGVTLHQVAEDGVIFHLDREFRFVGVGESTSEEP